MTAKKRMLINALHDEESRVAIAEDEYLHELDIESAHKALTKSNIYRGKITKVEASLQAAFVEYGAARQGFLPLGEIHPDYWKDGVDKSTNPRNLSIQDVLESKQQILVQVVKEERGNKGAALTTNISLAGRYLVLSPNTSRGGVSRKLSDDERRSMKEILKQLEVPDNMGLIIRTAGKDQTLEALQRDYNYLRRLWDEIRITSETTDSPALIYLEGDLATRAIRDHFSDDIQEIWVDNHEVYSRTKAFVHAVLPGKEKLVKLYRGKKPLFRHFGIESQCEEVHDHEVRLRTGGSIVLDPTEALTAIDVNSARATKGKHIDDTALAINLEAAEEIARQLRIRDIGGLIVIDFIDMANRKHGQQVEELLRKACKRDKARIQFARISRFGLLEMSRQRLHPSVRESTTEVCPRCQGRGSIRTVDSMALQMLTRMEDWAERDKKPTLVVQVPSDTGEYLMNNKRANLARIEEAYEIQITLQIRPDLDIPHYRIERQWSENNQQRIEVLEDTSRRIKPPRNAKKLKPVKPVVGIPTPVPSPTSKEEKKASPLNSLIGFFTGQKKKKPVGDKTATKEGTQKQEGQPKRRKRGGNKNRKRPSGQKNTAVKTTGDKDLQQNNKKQKTVKVKETAAADKNNGDAAPGEVKKRRRRRRRRRPAAANNAAAAPIQNQETPATAPKAATPENTAKS
ncbi:MAG: Rne/Rng family ribonuclease [Mariprofundus sp.]|nr:Rne/Rng family ribonuclease [Mariprofundus sp.]